MLNEYNLEDLYIKDVERRFLFPKSSIDLKEETYFPFYYINSYVQCKNTLIPSYDIKALLKTVRINPKESDSDSTLVVDNLKFLEKFDYMKDEM